MEQLIETLASEGYLKTQRIIDAFRAEHRKEFVTEQFLELATQNHPLPIGYGQTISQPLTVAFMLELLQPLPGETVLEVGAGSGWQTALLAHIVGEQGRIIAIERIKPLKEFGEANVRKAGFTNVEFVHGDGTRGYSKYAPYDKIIVAAAAEIGIPDMLLQQLKTGGRLVIPVGKHEQDMVVVNKVGDNDFTEERHPGFQFVPLVPGDY